MQFHGHVLLSSDDEDRINDRCPLNRPAAADVALDQGSVDCALIGIIGFVRKYRVAESAIVVMAFIGAPLKRGRLSVDGPRGGALRWRYLNAYCAHSRTWAGFGLRTWGARLGAPDLGTDPGT